MAWVGWLKGWEGVYEGWRWGWGSESLKVGGMLVVGEDAVQFRFLIYSSLAIKRLRWFRDCCSWYQVVMGWLRYRKGMESRSNSRLMGSHGV